MKISSTSVHEDPVLKVLKALSKGIDAYTGEVFNGMSDEVKKCCRKLYHDLEKQNQNRERRKAKTPRRGKRWSKKEDEYLIDEYNGGKSLKEIAEIHQRSSLAIITRLQELLMFNIKFK